MTYEEFEAQTREGLNKEQCWQRVCQYTTRMADADLCEAAFPCNDFLARDIRLFASEVYGLDLTPADLKLLLFLYHSTQCAVEFAA